MSDGALAAADLQLLEREREVEIVTTRPDGSLRRTIIWAVVEDGTAYVRSVRGERGHWFQAALDRPAEVQLVAGGRTIPVVAVTAADERSVARCSRALEEKYAGDPDLESMLVPQVLGTTLRLEPRET